jgi:hypothetical protein
MDVQNFLENSKDFPDNTPVKIGDTEVPLGSLRQLNATERTRLDEALKANATRQQELAREHEQVSSLASKAQQAYQSAQEAIAKAQATMPPPQTNEEVFVSPERLRALEKRFEDFIKIIDQQNKQRDTITQNMVSIWSEKNFDDEYRGLGPDFHKRDKKPTVQEIVKYATDNNILDRFKLPSVRLAWDKMNEHERIDELKKAEFQRGLEAGRMEQMAARIPPPGIPGAAPPPGPVGQANRGELGDLYAEAIKDPELRALIEQLPAGMA